MPHSPVQTNHSIKENTLYRYDRNVESVFTAQEPRHDQIINIFGTTSVYDEERHGWQEQSDMWLLNASLTYSNTWCGYNPDGEISHILRSDAKRIIIISDQYTNEIEEYQP